MLTYIAVINPGDAVRERWPHALPVSAELAEAAGKPPTHGATEPPIPRYLDVLLHGLRHLHHLAIYDATNAAAMGELWRQHLAPLAPALAGMYSEPHQAA